MFSGLPTSKAATVEYLKNHFDEDMDLSKIYRLLLGNQKLLYYLPMPCFIASNILDEMHISENIEISFRSSKTYT